jgi:hypothetical protein
MKKHPPAAPTATSKIKLLPKKIVSLKILEVRSLIEPEALKLYGDTCLHSTVSTLWNTHNIGFDRVSEKYGVHKVSFTRYTLQENSKERAAQLIAHYEGRLTNAK